MQKACKNKIENVGKSDEPVEKAKLAKEHLFMAHSRNVKAIDAKLWLLDSGASNHMTLGKKLFVEFNGHYRSRVEIRNGINLQVKKKGLVV